MTLTDFVGGLPSRIYHSPTFGIVVHGSAGASASPFWSSSTEIEIRRAHERHAAVARRPRDRVAEIDEALARGVDVVDLVGDVAEVAAAACTASC